MNIHLNEFPPIASPFDTAAIDIEIYGMRPYRLHHIDEGKFASLQISLDGENSYVITEERKVAPAIFAIQHATWVAHGASFDFRHLHRWANFEPHMNSYDTLLFEKILWGGYYADFGLKDLSRRYLNVLVAKEVREQFQTASEMTPQMVEYAALDPCLAWKIHQEQMKLATEKNLKVWREIDGPAMWALMDFQPFRLDVNKWLEIAHHQEITAQKIRSEFDFNPDSPKQTLAALQSSGLKRITSTGAEVLINHLDNDLVLDILAYRAAEKHASTYGKEFVEKHVKNGYVLPEIMPTQAETGRTATHDPNLANIPSSKEIRSCFLPSEGNCLIIADYNAQEPRITAWESGDENLREATATKGLSVHAAVGRKLFHDDSIIKGDPRYPKAKALNLALSYGMTANGLMGKINEYFPDKKDWVSIDEAEDLVDQYFKTFPGVAKWKDHQREVGQRQQFVETASGRKIWINLHSYQWKNNVLNGPIQGGGSDISKMATARIWRECKSKGIHFPLVNSVYDELVADVPLDQKDEYMEMITKAMVEEAEKVYQGVHFEVEACCAENWSQKP